MTWHHVWKFRLLLAALLGLIAIQPAVGHGLNHVYYTTAWSFVLIVTIYAISDIRWQRYVGWGFGSPILAGVWARHLLSESTGAKFQLVVFGLIAVFVAIVVVLVMRHLVMSEVTADNVAGAICAYLFLGLGMGMVYAIIESVQAHSFQAADHLADDLSDPIRRPAVLTYFSFVTLTTMGYGDMLPVTPLTRVLASLEAVAGQFYMAVLVAGLVGIRVSRRGIT